MQMKYLSLALAAALATTLTACGGSDNKGNYNKDTLTPVTKPDVKPGEGGNVKPDDENKKPDDGKKPGEDKPEDENKKPDDGKKPGEGEKVEDPKNNIGDAANPGNPSTNNIVVAQNYVRGEGTAFDKGNNPNPKNDGNPTVLGYNDLENTLMSNIVLAHVTKKNDDLLTVIAGQNPDEANNMKLRDVSSDVFKDADVFYRENIKAIRKQGMADKVKKDQYFAFEEHEDSLLNTGNSLQDRNVTNFIGSTAAVAYKAKFGDKIKVGEFVDLYNKNKQPSQPVINKNSTTDLHKYFAFKLHNGIDDNSGPSAATLQNYLIAIDQDGNYLMENGKYVAPKGEGKYKEYDVLRKITYAAPLVYEKNRPTALATGSVDYAANQLGTTFGNAYVSGLVNVKSKGKAKLTSDKPENNDPSTASLYMRGQEDQVITEEKGKVKILQPTGAPAGNDVRIFGALYKQGDIPAIKTDGTKTGFEENPDFGLAFSETVPKSYARDASWNTKIDANKFVYGINDGNTVADLSYSYGSQVNKNSYQMSALQVDAAIAKGNNNQGLEGNLETPTTSANSLILMPAKIHLDHVQYGRVTAQANRPALEALKKDISNDEEFSLFATVDKFAYQSGLSKDLQDKQNTKIDYYFARGLQPTKGADMPKEGKITYAGHALMYGLDNSYHGDNTNSNSNAPLGKVRHAVGNFVAAQLDAATKKVDGKIYNVWTRDSNNIQYGAIEDNLVRFTGSVNDTTNSVIGTATRTYVKDDKPAAFKGGFFGSGAEEFAGNINSIAGDEYGDSKWGGVFGAQRVGSEQLLISNGVEVKD